MNLPPLFRFLVKRRRKVLVGAKVHRKRGKLDMKERGVDSFRGSRVTPTDRVSPTHSTSINKSAKAIPSDLTTRATRKTTRFSVRDAKNNAARRHAPSCMGATELQSNWPEMRKTLGQPGFCSTGFRKLTERTGTELLAVFPMFLESSKGTF